MRRLRKLWGRSQAITLPDPVKALPHLAESSLGQYPGRVRRQSIRQLGALDHLGAKHRVPGDATAVSQPRSESARSSAARATRMRSSSVFINVSARACGRSSAVGGSRASINMPSSTSP
jgi:hypothetical protein